MPINPNGAAGYVTNRLQPRDANGGILRQYQDAGTDDLTTSQVYTSNGTTLPGIYAIQNVGAVAVGAASTYTANNVSLGGVVQASTTQIPLRVPVGSTIYGDFLTVTLDATAAQFLKLYKKLLP
jgi:hypothetical protein